jgi:hypothetical protein
MDNEEKREEYVIKIGKLLKEVLERQKGKIKSVTYDCVNPSDFEAGEIIAKKIIENKLV